MRKALVEILGDPKSFLNSLRKSSAGVESFQLDLKDLAVTAEKTAKLSVQASLKRDARLRQEVLAYRELSEAAKKGSREQVTAANHAAQAEARLARSLGVTEREARRLGRTSHATHGKIMQTARGAIAGSGAFRAMGRSIAFASATFLTFAGASQLIRTSIAAASDLTEQVNKAGVVFRGAKKDVVEWSHTLLPSFGLTRAEAIKMLGTFGNMLVPMGFARKAAKDMSETLVELAGDMASFNNASVEEVLQGIQAGLTNQPRPLRRFGVFLNQARIEAEALSSGIVKANVDMGKAANAQSKIAVAQARLIKLRRDYGASSTQAAVAEQQLFSASRELERVIGGNVPKLTNAQKALAIYRIILKDTADAHGDAKRTGKEWAGQMRSMHALAGDLEEELGKMLMPTFLKFIRGMVEWMSKSKNQKNLLASLKTGVDKLAGAMEAAVQIVLKMSRAADFLADHLGGWETALALAAGAWLGFKAAGVASAIAVQTANVMAAGITASAWRAALIATGWGALAVAAGAAAAYVITHWEKVKTFFSKLWIQTQIEAANAFLKIVEPFSHLPGVLGGWARDAKDHMKESMAGLKDDFANIGKAAGNALGKSMYDATKKWADATAEQRDIINLRSQQKQLKIVNAQLKQDDLVKRLGGQVWDWQGRKVEQLSKSERARLERYRKALLKQIEIDKERVRMSTPDTDIADQPDPTPTKPPPKPTVTDTGKVAKEFTLPLRLQLEEARADASGSQKAILKAARDVRAYILKIMPSLKGAKLLGAYRELAQANDTIADAAKDAAEKAKKDAEKAKKKLAEARKKLAAAVDVVRGQIGDLFEGPVLQPTEQQRKEALGVPLPSATRMLDDIRGQTKLFARFNRDLTKLGDLGASKELVKELRAKGTAAIPQIEALIGADKKTRDAFFREFGKRESLVQQIASTQINTPRVLITATRIDLGDANIRNAVNDRPIVIHHKTELDGKTVEKSTTKHQQKKVKRRTPQVRGPHAGSTLKNG